MAKPNKVNVPFVGPNITFELLVLVPPPKKHLTVWESDLKPESKTLSVEALQRKKPYFDLSPCTPS